MRAASDKGGLPTPMSITRCSCPDCTPLSVSQLLQWYANIKNKTYPSKSLRLLSQAQDKNSVSAFSTLKSSTRPWTETYLSVSTCQPYVERRKSDIERPLQRLSLAGCVYVMAWDPELSRHGELGIGTENTPYIKLEQFGLLEKGEVDDNREGEEEEDQFNSDGEENRLRKDMGSGHEFDVCLQKALGDISDLDRILLWVGEGDAERRLMCARSRYNMPWEHYANRSVDSLLVLKPGPTTH